MCSFALRTQLLANGALAVLLLTAAAPKLAAQSAVPNFGASGWLNEGTFNGGELMPVEGSPPLFRQDPRFPFVPNNRGAQPTYRIADLSSNPNVKPWAKDAMRKDNDEVLAGKIAYTARSSCHSAGVPGFDLFGFQPHYFLQEKNKVTIIYSGDQQVRHVYLDVPHSTKIKPSWYGESVGHYEGDTLVIDTVGLNAKTVVDNFRTPHTEKLHVVERWKLVEDGKFLEVTFTVDDPDTYHEAWSARQRFRQAPQPYIEEVCAEGNFLLFDYGIPVAKTADF